jgi:DNA-binding response OmpR family regulator
VKQTLLLVEDDKNLADGLLVSLEQAGYTVLHAERISEVKQYWEDADLVVLDRQLPDGDSVSHLAEWKKLKEVPVILLTALVTVKDKVAGLDSGADDYLTKPFAEAELFARIRAQLRSPENDKDDSQVITEHLVIDKATREVFF